jgi:hypothetical protein
LATCILRCAGRSDDQLGDPDVITQLWHDFADVGELERHVLHVDDPEPHQVAHAVASNWQAGALLI